MDPSTGDGFLHWLGQAQWGTVPAWFGGLSLVFAILLFGRDRRRDDRELIDKLAVWPTVSYDDKLELHRPDELVAPAQVKLQSKNAK